MRRASALFTKQTNGALKSTLSATPFNTAIQTRRGTWSTRRAFFATTEADKGNAAAADVKGNTSTDAAAKKDGVDPAAAALAAVKAELDEMKKQLQYAMADRENVRRILMRDVKEARETGLREFAKDLLDVSDNFERALDASKADAERLGEVKLLYDGVAMTEAQLHKVFERFGIKRFKPLGDKFDPAQHSALLELDSPDYPDGHVGVVIKNGFMLKERVLRPADVGVIRKPKSQ